MDRGLAAFIVAIILLFSMATSGCDQQHQVDAPLEADPSHPGSSSPPDVNSDPDQDFFDIVYPGEMSAKDEAQLLAIEATGQLRAETPLAQRIQTELSAIRYLNPPASAFPVTPSWHLRHLEIQFEDAMIEHGFDRPLQRLG